MAKGNTTALLVLFSHVALIFLLFFFLSQWVIPHLTEAELKVLVDSISVLVSTVSLSFSGMGDMAVSNSIGSNVFDILIGLGLPWAIQTLAIDYGSTVSGKCCNRDYGIMIYLVNF